MTIFIAGASGFIGQNLINQLKKIPNVSIRALSRKLDRLVEVVDGVTWVKGNLYSMYDIERAMKNCDVAIYLVHSMMPSAHLNQGKFEDFDLILADNFARAADKNCVRQIIYLGGLLPNKKTEDLSLHLRSRQEVEDVLFHHPVPATVLRASIVIGKNGSSFRIVENLIKRLPILICPKWVEKATQPIDVRDISRAISHCLLNKATYDRSFDLGGTEITSYIRIMQTTAAVMQKKRKFITIPFFSLKLSTTWVALFGGQSRALVSPLVNSLKHELVANPFKALPGFRYKYTDLVATIDHALYGKQKVFKGPQSNYKKQIRHSVRSVQRLVKLNSQDAIWLARRYMIWLDNYFNFIIVVSGRGSVRDFLLFNRICLLRLKLSINRSTPRRQLFYITGGLLDSGKNPRARIEFRLIGKENWAVAAIHDYYPTLPWGVYKYTQAIVHKWVMWQFKRYLESLDSSTKSVDIKKLKTAAV